MRNVPTIVAVKEFVTWSFTSVYVTRAGEVWKQIVIKGGRCKSVVWSANIVICV